MQISTIINQGLYAAIMGTITILSVVSCRAVRYNFSDVFDVIARNEEKSRREEIKRFKEYMSKEGIKVNEDNMWVCSIGVPHYPANYVKFVEDIDQKTMSDPEKLAPYVRLLEQNNKGPELFLLEKALESMKDENRLSPSGDSFLVKLNKIHTYYDKKQLEEQSESFRIQVTTYFKHYAEYLKKKELENIV